MTRYDAYPGTAIQVQLVEPKLDGVAITTADSTSCVLTTAQGATISTGTFSYTASLPNTAKAGWFANMTVPDSPQRCHIHSTLVKSGATMKWHDTLLVKDFT